MKNTRIKEVAMLTMVVLAVTISCHKKSDEVSPVVAKQEIVNDLPVTYRPKKVFYSTDSINYKLEYEYTYDTEGRIQNIIAYRHDTYNFIDHITAIRTYSPNLIATKRTFLNIADSNYYYSGYDSTFLNSDGSAMRTSSFSTYYNQAVMGNDTFGVMTSITYTYIKNKNVNEITTYGNENYSSTMVTATYILDSLGNIQSVLSPDAYNLDSTFITENGALGNFLDVTIYSYAGFGTDVIPRRLPVTINGRLTNISNPSSLFSTQTLCVWLFDNQSRPIALTNTLKSTGGSTTKSYVKFEY